jgi:glucokinase
MEIVAAHPDSELGRQAAAGEHVLGSHVLAAYRNGDELAACAVRRWAHAIGIGIANAVNTFDPDEVVIGGGAASAAGDALLGPARKIAEGYIVEGLRGHVTVRLARFGARAGVVGASLLAVYEARDHAAT